MLSFVLALALSLSHPDDLPEVSAVGDNVILSGPIFIDGRNAFRATYKVNENYSSSIVTLANEFKNGVIEMDVKAELTEAALETSRGFIGIAFRADEDLRTYEAIYLRPTNGRAQEQIRRNHSTQYVSHPEYPWYRLRKEAPGHYESYVDLELGRWHKMRIIVEGEQAILYVDDAEQPTLIINDLKHGPDMSGAVALWIGEGTDGYFSNIKIMNAHE